MKKLKFREIKSHVSRHTAMKWLRWKSNPTAYALQILRRAILMVSLFSKKQPCNIPQRNSKPIKCCIIQKLSGKVKDRLLKYNGLVRVHLEYVCLALRKMF